MKKLNVLENINADDVISVLVDMSVCSGNPLFCVETYSEGEIQSSLTDAFEIHYCNEFLRSLNLIPAELISYSTYPAYCQTVQHLNRLLKIKRAMETVADKPYSEMNVIANQVYQIILNRLLAKHHVASKGFDAAMQKRPLEEWVSEALAYFA